MEEKYRAYNYKFNKSDYETIRTIPLFAKTVFECCHGWFDILFDLGQKINAYCLENNLKLPKIQQVKEKFGTLRFYYIPSDDWSANDSDIIRSWVSKAEKATETTCEYCGKPAQLLVSDLIWKVVCSEHIDPTSSVYTVEEFTKINEERARKSRKCDVCGVGYAESYYDNGKFTNRCEKHKENFITSDEYFASKEL